MIQEKAAAGGPLTNSPGHAKKFGADFSHFVPNGHLFNEDLEKVSSEVRGKKAVRMPMLNGFCYAIHYSIYSYITSYYRKKDGPRCTICY